MKKNNLSDLDKLVARTKKERKALKQSSPFISYHPESTIEDIIPSESEKIWVTTKAAKIANYKKNLNLFNKIDRKLAKKHKFKKRRKIEIEGKNIIEKFFNIIAILWMDTPVGIVLAIALVVLFALVVGGSMDSGAPSFFTDTE